MSESQSERRRVMVVGPGGGRLGGVLAARAGAEVIVREAGVQVGGRCRTIERARFRSEIGANPVMHEMTFVRSRSVVINST